MGTDVLSSLAVQIDVANKRLFIDREVLTFGKIDNVQQSVQLVKFGQAFSPVHRTIPSGQEVTIWGQVRSVTSTEWKGIVEVTEGLCERSGLLGCATISVGGNCRVYIYTGVGVT